MTDLANLVVKLTAETSQYNQSINTATSQIQKFSADTTSALDKVGEVFRGLAAAFAVEKLYEFTKGVLESDAALVNFSASTGIAVENLSTLEAATKIQGVEDLQKGLTRLTRSILQAQEGSAAAEATFRTLGISVKDLNDANGDVYQVLLKVADAYNKSSDGAAKLAINTQLFGRGQQALVHVLDQGSEGVKNLQSEIDQLGGTISGSLAQNAKEFTENMAKLGIAVKGVANEALAVILPELIQYSEEADKAAKSTVQMGVAAEALVVSFHTILAGLDLVKGGFTLFKDTLTGIGGAALDLAKGAAFRQTIDVSGFSAAASKIKADFKNAGDEVYNDISGLNARFAKANQEAIAASKSDIQSVREGAAAGSAEVAQAIDDSLSQLSGQSLEGFRSTTNQIADLADGAAKKTQTAFTSAFATFNTAVHGSLLEAGQDFKEYESAVEEVARAQADLAKSAEAKKQLPIFSETAVTQLDALSKQLEEQVSTFGKGTNAALNYSIAQGKIHDEIVAANGQAEAQVASIRKSAAALTAYGEAADVKRVQEFIEALRQQSATFDQGTLAATQYAVEHGKLADQLALTGTQAVKFKAEILAAAQTLEVLKDQKAVEQLNIQMLQLTGHTEEAAKATFELQNAILAASLKNIQDTPLPKGRGVTPEDVAEAQAAKDHAAALEQQLQTSRELNDTLAEANQLQQEATTLQSAYDLKVQLVQDAISKGQETTIDGDREISNLRTQEIEQLQEILDKLKEIPGATNQPAIVDGITKLRGTLSGLSTQVNQVTKEIRGDFTDAATNSFTEFVTGAKSASDALLGFLNDIEKALINLVAKHYFEQLFSDTGSGGSIVGLLGGLLGGSAGGGAEAIGTGLSGAETTALYGTIQGFESGGVASAGVAAVAGEAGPEAAVADSGIGTPATSTTKGGTEVPREFKILGAHGPEIFIPKVPTIIITADKLATQMAAGMRKRDDEDEDNIFTKPRASDIALPQFSSPKDSPSKAPEGLSFPAPSVAASLASEAFVSQAAEASGSAAAGADPFFVSKPELHQDSLAIFKDIDKAITVEPSFAAAKEAAQIHVELPNVPVSDASVASGAPAAEALAPYTRSTSGSTESGTAPITRDTKESEDSLPIFEDIQKALAYHDAAPVFAAVSKEAAQIHVEVPEYKSSAAVNESLISSSVANTHEEKELIAAADSKPVKSEKEPLTIFRDIDRAIAAEPSFTEVKEAAQIHVQFPEPKSSAPSAAGTLAAEASHLSREASELVAVGAVPYIATETPAIFKEVSKAHAAEPIFTVPKDKGYSDIHVELPESKSSTAVAEVLAADSVRAIAENSELAAAVEPRSLKDISPRGSFKEVEKVLAHHDVEPVSVAQATYPSALTVVDTQAAKSVTEDADSAVSAAVGATLKLIQVPTEKLIVLPQVREKVELTHERFETLPTDAPFKEAVQHSEVQLTLPTDRVLSSAAQNTSEDEVFTRPSDATPLHQQVLLHTEKVIKHESEPQRMLNPREYEELLTDRYLQKRAGGGGVSRGTPYLVGEHGPELYVPDASGKIIPHDKMGASGPQVTNNFVIQAPAGSVSRATQVQISAAAARGLQTASVRNN